jgi:tetratricopeptide (TPR) repeat protein
LNLLVGFFFSFLAARLRLGSAFYKADQEARGVLETDRKIRATTDAVDFGPGMLVPPKNAPTLKDKVEARNLARTVEKLELTTSGPAFDADSYLRLAQSLTTGGQYDRAVSLLEVGMKALPNEPTLPVYAGTIYAVFLGDLNQAKQLYFKALSISPGFPMAFYNLACATARESKLPGADVNGLLDQTVALLRQAFANDSSLKTTVLNDPLWDKIDLSGNAELASLVRPSSRVTSKAAPAEVVPVEPEEDAPADVAPEEDAPADVAPEEDAPADVAPEEDAPAEAPDPGADPQ